MNGATQTQSPSETKLVAENDVLFTGAASTFNTKFGAYANNDVIIDTSNLVTVSNGPVFMYADIDCNRIGDFNLKATGVLDTTNQVLTMKGAGLVLDGTYNTGTAHSVVTGCTGYNIDVGSDGTTTTGEIHITQTDLQKMNGINITIKADAGDLNIYKTVASDTTNIAGRITLDADNQLVFRDSSVWKSVRAVSPMIIINADLKVNEGHLVLEASNYTVDAGVYVQSEVQNIYVEPTSGGSGSMRTNTPVTWRSANDVTFEVPMTVFGSGSMMFQADSDESAEGTVSFSSVSHVTVSDSAVQQIVVTGADLILESNMNAVQANVTIQPSNYSSSKLSVDQSWRYAFERRRVGRITTTTTAFGSLQTDQVVLMASAIHTGRCVHHQYG